MSRYIRPKIPGASVFLTVILVDRGADTLVRQIEVLRQAVRVTRAKRPFGIDAWVVLPDHMHCVWTLPEGDADFSGRMAEIKGQFTRAVRRSGAAPTLPAQNQKTSIQNPFGAIGEGVRIGEGSESGQAPTYVPKRRSGRNGSGTTTSATRAITMRMCSIVG